MDPFDDPPTTASTALGEDISTYAAVAPFNYQRSVAADSALLQAFAHC